MEFKEQINKLGKRVEKLKGQVKTEEATKNAFIMPFIQCLGYEIFNPSEVIPEFTADFGIKQGEKVDYAIIKDEKPTILIECKCHNGNLDLHNSQLFRYFSATSAKFGLLTNGIEFRFFTDLSQKNKMDSKPFFTFNILNFKDNQLDELKKFHKEYFDLDEISTSASELKYLNEIRAIINRELEEPSKDFVYYFAHEVYHSKITQKVISLFTPLVHKAFSRHVNDLVTDRIKTALDKEMEKQAAEQKKDDEVPEVPKIITTDEEKEAYFIIKSILRKTIDSDRVGMKDNQSYCAIILDDNSRKYFVRLYFDAAQKHFIVFDKNKKGKRFDIETLDDIFKGEKEIIKAVESFLDE